MTSPKLSTGRQFPLIDLPTLSGSTRSLAQPRDGFDWLLTLVYRGKHCPLCTTYLKDLNTALPELRELGVDVVAVSADSEDRAVAQMAEVSPDFDVAFGLTVAQMEDLGLYVSGPRNGMNVDGPFAEPGLFVINEDGALQITDVSNVPFARPSLQSIVKGIRFLRGMTESFPVNGSHAELKSA